MRRWPLFLSNMRRGRRLSHRLDATSAQLMLSATSSSKLTGQHCSARLVRCANLPDSPLIWQLGDESLPAEPPSVTRSGDLSEEQLAALQALHHVLLEVRWPDSPVLMPQIHVQDGNMICPSCSHVYAIKDGIPNMARRQSRSPLTRQLLQEHELR